MIFLVEMRVVFSALDCEETLLLETVTSVCCLDPVISVYLQDRI